MDKIPIKNSKTILKDDVKMNEITTQSDKNEIGTTFIIQKGIFKIISLYDYPDLKIVDEILAKNKSKKKQNLNQFLFQKKKGV